MTPASAMLAIPPTEERVISDIDNTVTADSEEESSVERNAYETNVPNDHIPVDLQNYRQASK